MGHREYPQVRYETGGAPAELCECCACAERAVATTRVAYSYMRGEDEMEPVCKRHRRMAEENASRFIAHMMTKSKFVKARAAQTDAVRKEVA